MRIAYVCADRGIPLFGSKGASVHVRSITTALSARGHDVHILCARLGSENRPPDVASIRHCENDPDIEQALRELAESGSLDVVLERYALGSGAARRTSTQLGVPLVLEVNAPLVLEAARWRGLTDVTTHLANERTAFHTADAVIVVSRALAKYVNAATPETPAHRISNGAATDHITAAAEHKPQTTDQAGTTFVGFTGSMKRWHGVHELLDTFAVIHKNHPETVLVLAGTGPEEGQLRERVITDPNLRDCVQFLGAVPHDNIPALLATFDIGVAPYLASEDFYFSPLKVVEYLAAGLPVVHPDLGDLTEMVADAGIAYEPSSPIGLAAALDLMLRDATLRRRCAAAARTRAPLFSWDTTAAAVQDVLDSVVSAPVRASS
jgi:glycosyltransferase involved in cell wall biosynthesis